MDRKEIAQFLQVPPARVDQLWTSGELQKTLYCPTRPIPTLSHSTIYDVLEYALTSPCLPVQLTKEVAALWIAYLAEADGWDDFKNAPWHLRTTMLLDLATEQGLTQMTNEPQKTALTVVATREALCALVMN
ncbi:hypothetical protein [uncultured Tateyamaria sp.]|uniref:hypothetical protein n=1 Tax=uncultured Tateyamaria sp. TaxID=455651 RepID=UPI0026154EFB|nr:hypothetical protein [uncultured Tateyamaria sp.]